MISLKKYDSCTLDIGDVSYVALTELQKVALKSIISLEEFPTQPSIHLVYVDNAMQVYVTTTENIKQSSSKRLLILNQSITSLVKKTGRSWKNILKNLWETTKTNCSNCYNVFNKPTL